jgi:FkbM family methyltransferase
LSVLDYSRVEKSSVEAHKAKDRFGPISERLIRSIYESFLQAGDTCIDVGVHFGTHLFPMRNCVGDQGHVFGVEANPERYVAILKRICRQRLANVHVVNVAASDHEALEDFYINQSRTGRSGLRENKLSPSDIVQKVTAYAAPLSVIVPANLEPKFIKIDIEGAEFPALLGARDLLNRATPLVVFEGRLSVTAPKFGFSMASVEQYFREIGYCVFDLFGQEIDLTTWSGGHGWNFIAGHDDAVTRNVIADKLTEGWLATLTGHSLLESADVQPHDPD